MKKKIFFFLLALIISVVILVIEVAMKFESRVVTVSVLAFAMLLVALFPEKDEVEQKLPSEKHYGDDKEGGNSEEEG